MVADEPAGRDGATRLVRAAGGVLFRAAGQGLELALVHRPRYDDWSLPKGKLAGGEHPLVAAVREVREETGVRGVPLLRLPSTRYLTGVPGVEKVVEYWAMRADPAGDELPGDLVPGGAVPDDEVDELRWMPLADAVDILTYGHDRAVLVAFAGLDRVCGVVVLIRHASAGEREQWTGPDRERPLDPAGRAAADRLTPLLAVFAPAAVVSAEPDRCVQTVAPLAARLGLPVNLDPRLNEGGEPAVAAAAVTGLTRGAAATVVCSQGKLIPGLLAALTGRPAAGYHTPKGAGWVLAFGERGLVGTAFLDAPEAAGKLR